jgi:hypothetical protein
MSFQRIINTPEWHIHRRVSRKGLAGRKYNPLFSKDFKIWFYRPAKFTFLDDDHCDRKLHVHGKFQVMVSSSSRPRHDASFMAWYLTWSPTIQEGRESRFCLAKRHLTRMWPSSEASSRLIHHWRCRVSAQDHGEPYHTEGANLLAETRVVNVCSTWSGT